MLRLGVAARRRVGVSAMRLSTWHTSVLVEEVCQVMATLPSNGHFVDCTVGDGGHAAALLSAHPSLNMLCIDRDPEAVKRAQRRLDAHKHRVRFHTGSYADVVPALHAAGFPPAVDGMLLDLGVADHHLNDPDRGFSLRAAGRLDMRFNATDSSLPTAAKLVNRGTRTDIADLLRRYADSPYADDVARAIVEWRGRGRFRRPIKSTIELRHVIDSAVSRANAGSTAEADALQRREQAVGRIWRQDRRGRWLSKTRRDRELRRVVQSKPRNPSEVTRCFQALRIAVNSELDHLRDALDVAPSCLNPAGVLAVIAFQPDESRVVQAALSRHSADDVQLQPLTATAIRSGKAEFKRNPRSRSAHLHVVQRRSATDAARGAQPLPAGRAGMDMHPGARAAAVGAAGPLAPGARGFHSAVATQARTRRGSDRQRAALDALERRRAADAAVDAAEQADDAAVESALRRHRQQQQQQKEEPAGRQSVADVAAQLRASDASHADVLAALAANTAELTSKADRMVADAKAAAEEGDMNRFASLMEEANSLLDIKDFEDLDESALDAMADNIDDDMFKGMCDNLGINPDQPDPAIMEALMNITKMSGADLDTDLDDLMKHVGADGHADVGLPPALERAGKSLDDLGSMDEADLRQLLDGDDDEDLAAFEAKLAAAGITHEDLDLQFDSDDDGGGGGGGLDGGFDGLGAELQAALDDVVGQSLRPDQLDALRDSFEAGSEETMDADRLVREAEWADTSKSRK